MLEQIIQYGGISGVALVAIIVIVRTFLATQEKQLNILTDIFENHLDHSTKALDTLSQTQRELATLIKNQSDILLQQLGKK